MELVELNKICDLQNGYAFKSSDYVESSNTLNCRMSNIRPQGYFDVDYAPKYLPDAYAETYKNYLLEDGDLVIAMTDMANDPKILGVPTIVETGGKSMLLNQRVGKLEIIAPELIHVPYLQYSLNRKSVKKYYTKFAGGGLQLNVGKKQILSVKIPLPPLNQQKKIASILDAADGYRQKTKALMDKYDELTQSLFLDMFGDPVTNPKGWEIKPLSDFIKSLNTGVSVNSTDKEFKKGDIGILKTSCVYTGIFRAEEAKVIREDEYERMKLNPTADSIIISRMNTSELVGKSSYISKDCNELYLPDRLWQSVKGELHHNVRWLSHAVSFQSFMNEISKISSGTSGSMKNISKKNYLNLKMIYPTLELQNQFADRVKAVEAQKAQAQESLAKAEDLFNSLLQKAFKGELV